MASTTVQKNMVFTTENIFDKMSNSKNSQKVDDASNSRNSQKVDDASNSRNSQKVDDASNSRNSQKVDDASMNNDPVKTSRKRRKSRPVMSKVMIAVKIVDTLCSMPRNRGYIVDHKKYFGDMKAVDNGITFKLVDVIKKRLHIWSRRRYILREIDEENVWDA